MPYLTDLDKALKQLDKEQTAYLLISKDRVRIQHLERRLLGFLGLPEDVPRSLFFGESLAAKEVPSLHDEVYSADLFSTRKLYRLLKADQMKAATLDAFLKSSFDEHSSNVLVLQAESLKSNSRLRKHFKSRKAILELKPIPDKELAAWTMSHGAALGLQLSGKVAELVVEIAEQQADNVDQILKQLKLYCEKGKAPKSEDVLALYHYHPDPNEFLLLGQILTRPPHEAERAIHDLLEGGKNAFLLLNLLGKSASRLLLIRTLLEQRLPQKEVAQRVGVSPWLFEKDVKLVKQAPKRKLESLHSAVIKADSLLKGKSLGPEIIFSQLIHSI